MHLYVQGIMRLLSEFSQIKLVLSEVKAFLQLHFQLCFVEQQWREICVGLHMLVCRNDMRFWFELTLLKSDISDGLHFMASMNGR